MPAITDIHLAHMSKHAARRRRSLGMVFERRNNEPAFTDGERAAKRLYLDRLLRLYMMSRALFCACPHCAAHPTDLSRSPAGRVLERKPRTFARP